MQAYCNVAGAFTDEDVRQWTCGQRRETLAVAGSRSSGVASWITRCSGARTGRSRLQAGKH